MLYLGCLLTASAFGQTNVGPAVLYGGSATTSFPVSTNGPLLPIQSTLPAAAAFTNIYSIWGTNFITIAPWTSQGIFYQGDPVTISNSIRTKIEVYDFHSNSITNAVPPVTLTNLAMGHYFVQVDGTNGGFGDRSQFSVWPKGYTNYPHADIGVQPTATFAESNRFIRISPGFSRVDGYWAMTCSNSARTNDWTLDSAYITNSAASYNLWCTSGYPCMRDTPVPMKVFSFQPIHFNTLVGYSTGWDTPAVDQTNSVASFVNDTSTFMSNAAVHFGTNFVYEILNEPNLTDLVFPYDPVYNPSSLGGSNVSGQLPAAMVVSACTKAIKFVCPTCKVWAPAVQGFKAANNAVIVNYPTYYSNVDVISFHSVDEMEGPVDSLIYFTNSVLAGPGTGYAPWAATDSNDEYIASIYPGKQFANDEAHPYSPDAVGKTNSWWPTEAPTVSQPTKSLLYPSYLSLPWTWQTLTFRWWKNVILWRSTGVSYIQAWMMPSDYDIQPANVDAISYEGGDAYAGWNTVNDSLGEGPVPDVDGLAMISWWIHNGTPLTNWLSGTPLRIVDPLGGYTNGTPGLHFWTWKFADGSTNTFVWADEEIAVTTNLGVGLTDMFSNQWSGSIGIEPVIAWGWPPSIIKTNAVAPPAPPASLVVQ